MTKRRANGEGNIRKREDGRWEGRYTSVNKVHKHSRFPLRQGDTRHPGRLLTAQKIRHVPAQYPHGVHALQILPGLLCIGAVDHIPVTGGYHRHLLNGKVFIELVEGGRGTGRRAEITTAAGFM